MQVTLSFKGQGSVTLNVAGQPSLVVGKNPVVLSPNEFKHYAKVANDWKSKGLEIVHGEVKEEKKEEPKQEVKVESKVDAEPPKEEKPKRGRAAKEEKKEEPKQE